MLVALFFLRIFSTLSEDEIICEDLNTCDSCIGTNHLCSWCPDNDFTSRRCNDANILNIQGCSSPINPKTILTVDNGTPNQYYDISPSSLQVVYRKNDTINFEIKATLKKYMPTQTVFVIDFSNSMEVVFEGIIDFIRNFSSSDNLDITDIGATKYVDKTSHPIIDFQKYNTSSPSVPFFFAIISPVTSDRTELLRLLNQQVLSSNVDIPEATLDAVVQSVVCNQMGWSPDPRILKSLVVFTDQTTKMQLDGKIVGVIRPNNLLCHADLSGMNPNGMIFDYVSVGQTGKVLRENRFQIIFAVPQKVRNYYTKISSSWWGVNSAITDLNPDNFNISKILMDSKKELNSKFKITYPPTDHLEISITTKCKPTSPIRVGDECLGVELGQEVTFGVQVRFLKVLPQYTIKFDISPLAVFALQHTGIGSCPCSSQPPNRLYCNNHGVQTCGACECDEPWGGDKCECNKNNVNAELLCTNPNTRTICSERGTCNYCGKCKCVTAPDGLLYEGEFCQCGRTRCEKFQNQVCGGPSRGKCECESCTCAENYSGKKCELKNCSVPGLSQNCIRPGETVNCSKLGDCVCGECRCVIGRSGQFCEIRTAPYTCIDFKNEASCLIHSEPMSEGYDCNAPKFVAAYVPGNKFQCVMIDKLKCEIYYNFTLDENGEFIIQVKEFDQVKDCPKPINVFLVTGLVFAALFVVGLVLIGLYLLAMYLYYKADYNRFLKASQSAKPGQTNPLYQPGKGEENPYTA